MKQIILKVSAMALLIGLPTACTTQSALNNTSKSISVLNGVQGVLNSGILDVVNIFSDSNNFLTNALVEAAMPKQLKDINDQLASLGLNDVVTKEKEMIGKVASETVKTAAPILKEAVKNISTEDAVRILAGGKGAGTQFLKDKTYSQLVKTVSPIVTDKLNTLGADKLLSSAFKNKGKSNSLLDIVGTIAGGVGQDQINSKLSTAVSEQLINSMFSIVSEQENKVKDGKSILNTIFNN